MGRPCRCCKPSKPKPKEGKCPCTPWRILSTFWRGGWTHEHCSRSVFCSWERLPNDDYVIREEGTHSAEERAACEEHSTPFEPFVNMSDEWSQNVSGELEEYSGFIHLPCSSMCCFGDSDDPLIFNEGAPIRIQFSKIIYISREATVNLSVMGDVGHGWENSIIHATFIRKFVKTTGGGGLSNPADEESAADNSVTGSNCCESYKCKDTTNSYGTIKGPQYAFTLETGKGGGPSQYGDGLTAGTVSEQVEWSVPPIYIDTGPKENCSRLETFSAITHVSSPGGRQMCRMSEREDSTAYEAEPGWYEIGYSYTEHNIPDGMPDGWPPSVAGARDVGEAPWAGNPTFDPYTPAENPNEPLFRAVGSFEFTFTPKGDPDIWPEGSDEHERALKIITEDVLRADTENCITYEDLIAYPDHLFAEGSRPPYRPHETLEKLKEGGCLCYGQVWDANGTFKPTCSYLGCQDLTPKDLRTVWTHNPDKARKANCPEPDLESVIDCGEATFDDDNFKSDDFGNEFVYWDHNGTGTKIPQPCGRGAFDFCYDIHKLTRPTSSWER